MARIQRFCTAAVLVMVSALLALLVLTALVTTAHLGTWGGKSEAIAFERLPLWMSLVSTLAAVTAVAGMNAFLRRFAKVHMSGALTALWAIGTLALIIGMGTRQIYDAATVLEAGKLFAQGNYKMMASEYINAYSYQLGWCLPLELLARTLPWVDLNLLMQGFNVMFSVGTAGAMAALAEAVFEREREKTACCALYLLMLPAPLVCQQVYGTLPMLFLLSLSLLCFAKYVRTGEKRFGAGYALLSALAYMIKPNAAIVLTALLICAVLDALNRRTIKPLAFALAAAVFAMVLAKGVVWQYEKRSGVMLRGDVSMLARFEMGLQEGGGAAGWFNCYTEPFFAFDVSREQQRAIVMADLQKSMEQFRENPASARAFAAEKFFSQWLEPTYGTLWNGALCEHGGAWDGLCEALFSQESGIRSALETCMGAMQRALYLLALIGTADGIRKRKDSLQTALPLIVLGGMMYHMLFEAKSQYAYVYAVLLVPLAARGLCRLEDYLTKGISTRVSIRHSRQMQKQQRKAA